MWLGILAFYFTVLFGYSIGYFCKGSWDPQGHALDAWQLILYTWVKGENEAVICRYSAMDEIKGACRFCGTEESALDKQKGLTQTNTGGDCKGCGMLQSHYCEWG